MRTGARRHFRCPYCLSMGGRTVLWGMPSMEAADDDVFIAGCMLERDSESGRLFDRGCVECRKLWLSGKTSPKNGAGYK